MVTRDATWRTVCVRCGIRRDKVARSPLCKDCRAVLRGDQKHAWEETR